MGFPNFLHSLTRRKQVDYVNARRDSGVQLAKTLTVLDLIAIALTISFLIAGIAAALSAFCYAELACRCPSAGSAYHYSYICVGEGVAWLIGWALILEYTIGGSAVARGISPNLALFFGGQDNLPAFLALQTIPLVGIVVDPCAAILVLIVTVLLCIGIKESTVAQSIVTTINICALVFVIIAGTYLGFKTGWVGYELPKGYFPYGVNGMIAGSSVVFFSYIGFDSIASTSEEVKHPQRDLPLGIAISLAISCILYMSVSVAIVGIVPYYSLDPDTPISSAFSTYGMQWAAYIITSGAVTALVASLMGSILPQPRILMAMARDGLLPSFFSNINKDTQVPVNSTIVTGVLAAALAFCMEVSQLAGMVSVGTLLAFTTVAICVLIIRYVPPEVVSIPPSLQDPTEPDSYDILESTQGTPTYPTRTSADDGQHLLYEVNLARSKKEVHSDEEDDILRRRFATWAISLICIGAIMVASGASAEFLARHRRIILCLVGALILLCSLCMLACIDQDDARHRFGHRGGFICPLVPYLPVACILINTYLLVNLGAGTWLRVSIWLLLGALLYLCYGRSHSTLSKLVYTPTGFCR